MKKLLLLIAFLLPLVAIADSQPAMYTVHGKHNVMRLVGTVHLLQSTDALPESISKAYRDSSRLLMEIDTTTMDPMSVQELMLTSGMLPEDQTLESYVGAATYAKVKSAASNAGIDVVILDRMRPWLVSLTLEELMLAKMGFDPNSGIEMQLGKRAAQDHKSIVGLETLAFQISLFANLNKQTEIEYLTSTLDELGNLRTGIMDLINAWRIGDEGKLVSLLEKEIPGHEHFYDALIFQRNKRWVAQLTDLLEHSEENHLVAVGALHLVGDRGLISLLRKAGYKVTRD